MSGTAYSTDTVVGVSAALCAPLVMSIGLLLWEKYWIGSAVRIFSSCTRCSLTFIINIALMPLLTM